MCHGDNHHFSGQNAVKHSVWEIVEAISSQMTILPRPAVWGLKNDGESAIHLVQEAIAQALKL